MSETVPYHLDTDTLLQPFKNHLDIPNNDRIFFSGKFGTGKTSFLNYFFTEKSEDYETYHLYPVNYQISNEENIIDLLKYDILVEIMKKADQKGTSAFSEKSSSGVKEQVLLFSSFLSSTYTLNDVLSKTIEYGTNVVAVADSVFKTKFHKLGRPLQDLLSLDKAWQDFRITHEKNNEMIVNKFIETVKIREDSVMTHLIHKEIEKSEKTSVLIIDDLDRIDPEHIFKILNIFSGFHEREGGNKFGFDKMIIVGDIHNLEHIFHHFYGDHTDFTGYIDKFFSRDIYLFSSNEIVGSQLNKVMGVFGQKDGAKIEGMQPDYFAYDILHRILTEAVQHKTKPFTLRQIIKMINFNESILRDANYEAINARGNRTQQVWRAFEFVFGVCNIVFEEKSKFVDFCEVLKNRSIKSPEEDRFYNFYSLALLFKATNTDMTVKMYTTPTSIRNWGEYQTTPYGDDALKLEMNPSNKNVETLFYDLLAHCVKNA